MVALNPELISVKLKLQYVEKYKHESVFDSVSEGDKGELLQHIAPIVRLDDTDELAKRFDNFMYGLMLASMEQMPAFKRAKKQLCDIATLLERKVSIPQVKEKLPIIKEINIDEFWTANDVLLFEKVRAELRELMKFLDREPGKKPIITRLTDPIINQTEGEELDLAYDFEDYRDKVNRYIGEHGNTLGTEVPTSFDSIPVLNNQNATFYYFIDSRGDKDIDDLWELFESALKYAKNPTVDNREALSRFFDAVINKKGNGNSKITMGLYWIAPDSFLNLDSRNEWYIYKSGKIPSEVVETLPAIEVKIPAEKYFAIVEKLRAYLQGKKSELKDFKELSFAAWTYSTQVNEEQKAAKKQEERTQKGAGLADEDVDETHYWIYSLGDGASRWEEFYERGVMGLGWSSIGDLTQYLSKDEMKAAMKETIDPSKSHKNGAHATWQFLKDMKVGDISFRWIG